MNITIVTASIGHGHNSVASSIKETMMKENPSNNINIYDFLDDSKIYHIFKSLYLEVISKTPYLYSRAYQWTQTSKRTDSIVNFLNFVFLKNLINIKSRFRPDVLIFTHPFPVISYQKVLNIPAWTVITDFSFHPIWFNSEMEGYFVANEDVKQELLKRNYPSERIFITGIPTKSKFHQLSKLEHLKALNLHNDKPLILIMGGGFGIGSIKEIIDNIQSINSSYQAIILTGHNLELYQIIKKTIEKKRLDNCQVLSFTDKVPTLMKKASLLITKAGGVTLAEASISGLPTIIYKPIPGHEEENAHHACKHGWTAWAKDIGELMDLVNKLLDSYSSLGFMKKRAVEFSKPFASKDISKIVVNSIKHPQRRIL